MTIQQAPIHSYKKHFLLAEFAKLASANPRSAPVTADAKIRHKLPELMIEIVIYVPVIAIYEVFRGFMAAPFIPL